MAELVTGHVFKNAIRAIHDWQSWLDGRQWKLIQGEDFEGKPAYLASQARLQASKRGKRVHITLSEKEGWLILQAEDMTAEEIAEAKEKAAVRKAEKEAEAKEPKEELGVVANAEAEQPQEQQQEQPKKGRKGKGSK